MIRRLRWIARRPGRRASGLEVRDCRGTAEICRRAARRQRSHGAAKVVRRYSRESLARKFAHLLRRSRRWMMAGSALRERLQTPFREFGLGAGLSCIEWDGCCRGVRRGSTCCTTNSWHNPLATCRLCHAPVLRQIGLRNIVRRGAPEVERMPAREDIWEWRLRSRCGLLRRLWGDRWLGFRLVGL